MSIQTELTRITNAKAAIKAAIEGKGVTVPDGTLLDDMAALIESIEAGGGGDVVYTCGSFTPSEAIELNNSVTDPAYVVEHNLGVVPNLFLMGKFNSGYTNALDLFIVRRNIFGALQIGSHTAERITVAGGDARIIVNSNCANWPITANAMPIIPYISQNTKYILAPQKYYWIAIGGLAE